MSDREFHERFERTFFERVPREVAETFSDAQIAAVKSAFGGERWDGHHVDVRGTLPLPGRRWYFVLVAGPDRRAKVRPKPRGRPGAARRFIAAAVGLLMVALLALILVVGLIA